MARAKKKSTRKASVVSLANKNRALWELVGSRNSNTKQRTAIINKMSKNQFDDIAKLLRAFMSGRFPVSSDVLQKLKRDRKYLYSLAEKRTPVKVKRKILRQKGGFLPLLAPLIASVVPPLVGGIVDAVKRWIEMSTGRKLGFHNGFGALYGRQQN